MRALMVVILVLGVARSAQADHEGEPNVLVGPLLGILLGSHTGHVIEIEGGVGKGPERLNLGFEYRDRKGFAYVELDPWFIIGGSLGVGVDTDGSVHPVLGVWEGFGFTPSGCPRGYRSAITLAVGYRYSGVHELYFTPKVGVARADYIL